MGLIDALFGRKNVTFDWRRDERWALVVDMDRGTFCGVRRGEPIEKLSKLGPCDDPRKRGSMLDYRRLGFYLIQDEGRFEGVVFRYDGGGGFEAFLGKWVYRGREVGIGKDVTVEGVRGELGEAYWEHREEPEDYLVSFYEIGGVEYEFAWTPGERRLETVDMCEPEMGDAGTRKAYGVTKDWVR